jgi:hypothetical protein
MKETAASTSIAVLSSRKEHIAAAGTGMLGYVETWPLQNRPVEQRIASAIFLDRKFVKLGRIDLLGVQKLAQITFY